MFSIGEKIKQLRSFHGLTQEELADRTELSKGFISQLERDLTSPSIATLMDILDALGSDLPTFFTGSVEEKIVFKSQDAFVKVFDEEDDSAGKYQITWLVTNAQKNSLEPIMLLLEPGGKFEEHEAHEGEEFGYVLRGHIELVFGKRRVKVRKGDSFYFKPNDKHYIENTSKAKAEIIWISSPPTF